MPTSTVKAVIGRHAQYCVSRYAPNSNVSVRAERTGATASIHTDNHGSGCASVAVADECSRPQLVVAVGTGADGNPATSSATVAPRASAACTGSGQAASSTGTGAGELSGGDAVLLGVAGALMVALAIVAATAMRRRRAGPPS